MPPGYIGYEEHQAGSKGLHMNSVFVADVAADAAVSPNHEFSEHRWVDAAQLAGLESPRNVREIHRLPLTLVKQGAELGFAQHAGELIVRA